MNPRAPGLEQLKWRVQQAEGLALEVIANHYREAAVIALEFEAGSPETEELRKLAVDRLLRAARQLANTALPEALGHVRSAAELVADEDRQALLDGMDDLTADRSLN